MWKLLLIAAVVSGCGKKNPNCDSAVDHVFNLTVVGPKPSADEQKILDQVKEQSKERCNSEGLSVEQRDCILAAKSLTDRAFLTCPALVAKKPSWIIAPIGQPDAVPQP